jgi:hypothetical protein
MGFGSRYEDVIHLYRFKITNSTESIPGSMGRSCYFLRILDHETCYLSSSISAVRRQIKLLDTESRVRVVGMLAGDSGCPFSILSPETGYPV